MIPLTAINDLYGYIKAQKAHSGATQQEKAVGISSAEGGEVLPVPIAFTMPRSSFLLSAILVRPSVKHITSKSIYLLSQLPWLDYLLVIS